MRARLRVLPPAQQLLQHVEIDLVRLRKANASLADLRAGKRAAELVHDILLQHIYTANLLLLDEPTNHLEIEAQEALEKTLVQYPGAIVLVSHDRSFLEAISPEKRVEL